MWKVNYDFISNQATPESDGKSIISYIMRLQVVRRTIYIFTF